MKEIQTEILEFCKTNKITIVEGNPNSYKTSTWINLDLKAISDFLEFAKNANSKVIVLISLKFNLKDEIIEYLDFNSFSDEKEINEVISILNTKYDAFEGESYLINLFFPLEGAFFNFTKKADWYNNFISELDEYANSKPSEEEVNNTTKLSDEIIEKLVSKIASSSEFYAFHTRPPRIRQFILKVLDEEKIDGEKINLSYLERASIKLFERKFRTQLEKDFKEQIQILKNNGKTKKAIIGILQITEGIYDSIAY
jgi:hypothetical protein